MNTRCYYHTDKPALFRIPADGGGKIDVCARCHSKIKGKKDTAK